MQWLCFVLVTLQIWWLYGSCLLVFFRAPPWQPYDSLSASDVTVNIWMEMIFTNSQYISNFPCNSWKLVHTPLRQKEFKHGYTSQHCLKKHPEINFRRDMNNRNHMYLIKLPESRAFRQRIKRVWVGTGVLYETTGCIQYGWKPWLMALWRQVWKTQKPLPVKIHFFL